MGINIIGDNLLLQRVQDDKKSEFEMTDRTVGSSKFLVKHAGLEYDANAVVILKPGNYSELELEGEVYTFATDEDVIGFVEAE